MTSRTILYVVLVCVIARKMVMLLELTTKGLLRSSSRKTSNEFSSTRNKTSHLSLLTTKVEEECSCWSLQAPPECCERIIFRGHKFGYVLVRSLFQDFRHRNESGIDLGGNKTLPRNKDYRHVVVTRNFADAIVSGYLYHKSGRECWLDLNGAPRQVNKTSEWDAKLNYHWSQNVPYPPRNDRSICSYLEEESEEDGIRILMDVALSRWYSGHLSYWNLVQKENESQTRSLFFCYEDLVDPFQQERLFHEILDFMYPGQDMATATMPRDARVIKQQRNQNVYTGPHATSHDPDLRTRLKALVKRYDDEYFNGTIAKSTAIFGCGKRDTKT